MPITVLPQTPTSQGPCRVFIDIDMNTLREYDPTIALWQFTDSGSSLLRKSKDSVTRIAEELHQLLFGSSVAVPDIERGLLGDKHQFDHATVQLGYDHSFKHDTFDTPILRFTSRSVHNQHLVFAVEQLSDEHRKIENKIHAQRLAHEQGRSRPITQTL